MLVVDVNVLINAHREEAEDHERYKLWLSQLINGDEPFGVIDLALSGFLRIVTNPRIYDPPTPMNDALVFVDQVRSAPNAVPVMPGAKQWDIFEGLCRRPGIRGNLVPDAYYAALVIESGNEWITCDGDFARFQGLRWRHPFDT